MNTLLITIGIIILILGILGIYYFWRQKTINKKKITAVIIASGILLGTGLW